VAYRKWEKPISCRPGTNFYFILQRIKGEEKKEKRKKKKRLYS
jgi:hypothetical protein